MKTRAVRPQEAFGDRLERAKGAHRRSMELLLMFLSDEQRAQFLAEKRFKVIGGFSGTTYIINWGRSMNIEVQSGMLSGTKLCCYPREQLPVPDVMLAQKMWLETDELEFVRKANKFANGTFIWAERGI
jgi:hypothetical protein